VGELCRSDPAEIECPLVTDVADRKSGLTAGPAELEANGALLDATFRCESIGLDLGQAASGPENAAEFHDHEPPGGRSGRKRSDDLAVVGLHYRLVDELRLPIGDGASDFCMSYNSQNLSCQWRTALPTQIGE